LEPGREGHKRLSKVLNKRGARRQLEFGKYENSKKRGHPLQRKKVRMNEAEPLAASSGRE